MDWEVELISLYLFVSKHYQEQLSSYCQRMTNYADLRFSDEESITLYLFGVIEGYHTIKGIHRYAKKHLMHWFPRLPDYKAFDYRMNQLHDIFVPFVHLFCDELLCTQHAEQLTGLTDSANHYGATRKTILCESSSRNCD